MLESDWKDAGQNTINHASNLSGRLANIRDADHVADRPIIFVAHSLGGLVVEDVTVLDGVSDRYPLLKKVTGPLFKCNMTRRDTAQTSQA